ncbi:MAG TPA: TolC family protein [Candidatus Acidoferrum sp.]|nr:TolC family protein [Candidatus Acidoferrum sp.]
MRLTKVFGLLLCCAAVTCPGQSTNRLTITGYPALQELPLSLDEAVRLALEHDLTLQVERYRPVIIGYNVHALLGAYYDPVVNLQARRDENTSESGGFNPITGAPFPGVESKADSFSGGLGGYLPTGMRYDILGNASDNSNIRSIFDAGPPARTFRTNTETWRADAGIAVTQPLLRNFWTDASRTGIKLRKRDKRISELELEQFVHDTVRDVVEAYYTLVGRLEAVIVAETDLRVKQQNFDETRRKVEVGTLAPLDEKKAQAEVAQAKGNLVQALNDAADAEALLKTRISDQFGRQVGVRIKPTDKLLVNPAVLDLPTSYTLAMDKRPNLQARRETLDRHNIQLKYDYNQLFPSLDVFASYGVNGLDDDLGGALRDLRRRDFPESSYGVILNFPLTMKRERSVWKADKVLKAQLVTELKREEETAIFEVDNAIRGVSSAYQLVFVNRERVAFAEADLAAEQRKFQAGKSTSFFVLDAASRLAAARNDEIQALIDYNLALNALSHAEGTILDLRKIDFEAVRYPPTYLPKDRR